MKISELRIPGDFLSKFGRKDAWHGDTHTGAGGVIPESVGKPRVIRTQWYPTGAQADHEVTELRIIYDDGIIVKVPAEELKK